MNILCNPTGKPGCFRAIDWLVEHNNLYIKRIYGGKYSDHTVDRIIAESVLIEVYKNIRMQFEQMFCLDHKTTRHSLANMQTTFNKLLTYMLENQVLEHVPARKSQHEVVDAITNSLMAILKGKFSIGGGSPESNIGEDQEVVDDVSLDV
ncbi:hypothetical protein BKA70DRAFT_1119903 [Coprinopsis sp. MPI-PUGE-AT-0042]|nr:hypothetical protein BKA70DRAFT_1119903 [Coprinopsis sp. MPI-PUGE-AT-0042]